MGPFVSFRQTGALKAVQGLALSKAPGSDLLPIEVSRHLTAALPLLTQLINGVISTGSIPAPLRLAHLAPIAKPGKDPEACESQRPMSLINAIAKIIEAAVYNRVIHDFDAVFHSAQYAYVRARGTEIQLAPTMGVTLEHLQRGRFVSLASLDIGGGSGAVSHD